MGDEQRLGYEEMLAQSRAAFDAVPDFTVAVEEEFALLDPETLDLVNRFEELQDAAPGTELEPHLVGELIASEVEVRTGRCDSFADAAALHRRAPRSSSARSPSRSGSRSARPARIRGARGRSSGSSTRRTTAATTRSSATSSGATTPSACTSTSASTAPTARSASARRSATTCRSCSRSPRARRSSRASSAASTRRARRSSRGCSRAAAIPDALGGWDEWETLRPLPLRDRLDHRAHADLVERAAAPHVPDGRDPDLRRAARRRRVALARGARATRSPRGSRARSTRASRCPTCRTA